MDTSNVDSNRAEEYRVERGSFRQPVCMRVWRSFEQPPASFAHTLDHVHIERVLYKGAHTDGRAFVYCEPVDGTPIDRFCDERRLSFADRIRMLLQVMDALEYAHRHLYAHGDLSAANIVVNQAGQLKVMRFGTASNPGAESGRTAGTDVLQLGRLAAHLLAGLPTAGEPAQVRPTQWFNQLSPAAQRSIAAARSTTVASMRRALRGDADAVLADALAPGREHRYSNVEELRNDLHALLRGEATSPYRAGRAERLWRWCRFHVPLTAAVVALVVTAAAASAVFLVQTEHLNRERALERARLAALVRMTGELNARLYTAAAEMPHPAPVRLALVRHTRQALDAATPDGPLDPALLDALALQYAGLAEHSAQLENGSAEPPQQRAQAPTPPAH